MFTQDADGAAELFHTLAKRAGQDHGRFVHALTGPEGEGLAMGWCRVGPADARRVLLVTSGMHGIEGYAGSAVQCDLLAHGDFGTLPADTAIVFIHLLNPWGLAWARRENEDNVDLFRNFLYCEPPFFDAPDYDALGEAICPAEWTGPVREAADQALKDFIAEHGMDRFVSIFRRGQHSRPGGLTYHGRGPVWSTRHATHLLKDHLRKAERVLSVDIHTGFGAFGEGLIVGYAGQGRERLDLAEDWFGPMYIAGGDPLIPSHRCMPLETLQGKATDAQILSVGLEFGTYDLEKEIDTLRHINHVFALGDPTNPEGQKLRARFAELLNPDSEAWRLCVLERGREVIGQALDGLARWPDTVSLPPPAAA